MRRGSKVILTVCMVAVLLGGGLWWWRALHLHPRVNASEYETDMTEGLVRGVLRDLGANAPAVCFLAFGEGRTPPSGRFVARFANTRPQVKSASSAASPSSGGYFGISNGRRGLIIRIVRFREITPTLFETEVAFSNLPAGHDRFVYRVANQGGQWVVLGRNPA